MIRPLDCSKRASTCSGDEIAKRFNLAELVYFPKMNRLWSMRTVEFTTLTRLIESRALEQAGKCDM
ncbi:hypothetical protein ACTXT7_002157 [Hymenolepis weldensis]